MARPRRRKASEQHSDYDGAWKESARLHLREILEKYFPGEKRCQEPLRDKGGVFG
jgi:hypothetical protein